MQPKGLDLFSAARARCAVAQWMTDSRKSLMAAARPNAQSAIMTTTAHAAHGTELASHARHHCVDVQVTPALTERNRLTTAFRPLLAIPHLLLVGGPVALSISLGWHAGGRPRVEWGATTGVLGAVAAVCALIAWFAIVFGARYPDGLRSLALFYLRWRVRAGAYLALLCDEYPPFGDGNYPAALAVQLDPNASRNRWSVAFRLLLVLPHAIAVWVLGVAWMITTLIAWCSILVTGNYPAALYEFGVGVLRWGTRVEAYLLLLHDEYPPFSLDENRP
jgi:hypothetical protein